MPRHESLALLLVARAVKSIPPWSSWILRRRVTTRLTLRRTRQAPLRSWRRSSPSFLFGIYFAEPGGEVGVGERVGQPLDEISVLRAVGEEDFHLLLYRALPEMTRGL